VPTLILTGIVHLFVFLAVDAIGFLWLSIGMALANGIGSGVIMVIGADLAPPKTRNQFLASFRLIIDAAQAATPPILAVGAAAVGLAGSMTGFGLLAFGGAWLMHRYIPRFGRH
jgi:hypothetical protein